MQYRDRPCCVVHEDCGGEGRVVVRGDKNRGKRRGCFRKKLVCRTLKHADWTDTDAYFQE